MLTAQDRALLDRKGISEAQLREQLERFAKGFPYLKLKGAAAVGQGILRIEEAEQDKLLKAWDDYLAQNPTVVKFVPASGAASRMFKDLFAFVDGDHDEPETAFEKLFFGKLGTAAFKADIDAACTRLFGKDTDALMREGRYKDVARTLLGKEGLNYGALPKGLLKFHRYTDSVRTPVEEHLVEAALYACGGDGKAQVHFTVSPEHRALFEALVSEVTPVYEKVFGVKYHVTFSEQSPATDTVAANADNTPFRNADGSLLFRPGGHGALIVNLNRIMADVVFVKNIDNVVPDRLKDDTVRYKKLLAGLLVTLQERTFAYMRRLDQGATRTELLEMLRFLEDELCCHSDKAESLDDKALARYLRTKFNRPMRIAAMVKNVGEPGGGPFLAYNSDGTVSCQILESSQIDMADPKKKALFEKGTHFNPVDLVCGLRNYRGTIYDLPCYVDEQTGFISHKSKDGRELKALELPGLWNGAMSDWNTVFVEVPLSTFNPVKTVNDLYREQHQ
ncbi:MAG: DUF4301 family protein [Bacteroidaceae bacterium]|nr:DUF4301 family protein [Bacteroidaceae bacterium]